MNEKNREVSYLTLRQISEKYTFLSLSGWRCLIFHNDKFNEKCVRRIGRRLLLNEDKVLEFIENSPKNRK